MNQRFFATIAGIVALIGPAAICAARAKPAQQGEAPLPPAGPGYVEVADLVLASPVIIDATIRSTTRIKGTEAAGLQPGYTRFYVEADVGALIRGPGAIPPRIGYLLDAAPDGSGRPPKYRKARVLLFARPVSGRPDQFQLVTPTAQRGWTAELDSRARSIVREVLAPDAPPIVTGVNTAFHVPGSLPGEGETQIFLATEDRRPAALSILRRPGEPARWSLALSEIVDDAAAAPRRDTLLWYRLACGLPRSLPPASTAAIEPSDSRQAQADYRFVLQQLGPCRGDPALSGGGGPG